MRLSTCVEPDCIGRCTCSHTASHLRHRGDHAVAEVVRMRAREAQAPNAGHGADGAEQVGEIVLAVVVRIDRLAEQHDFRHPLGDDRLRVSRTTSASLRLRSGPRVVGTMQYVQR